VKCDISLCGRCGKSLTIRRFELIFKPSIWHLSIVSKLCSLFSFIYIWPSQLNWCHRDFARRFESRKINYLCTWRFRESSLANKQTSIFFYIFECLVGTFNIQLATN
jgi:hypothetical protein